MVHEQSSLELGVRIRKKDIAKIALALQKLPPGHPEDNPNTSLYLQGFPNINREGHGPWDQGS